MINDGLMSNGPNETLGDFDLDRVNNLIEIAGPVYSALGQDPPSGPHRRRHRDEPVHRPVDRPAGRRRDRRRRRPTAPTAAASETTAAATETTAGCQRDHGRFRDDRRVRDHRWRPRRRRPRTAAETMPPRRPPRRLTGRQPFCVSVSARPGLHAYTDAVACPGEPGTTATLFVLDADNYPRPHVEFTSSSYARRREAAVARRHRRLPEGAGAGRCCGPSA